MDMRSRCPIQLNLKFILMLLWWTLLQALWLWYELLIPGLCISDQIVPVSMCCWTVRQFLPAMTFLIFWYLWHLLLVSKVEDIWEQKTVGEWLFWSWVLFLPQRRRVRVSTTAISSVLRRQWARSMTVTAICFTPLEEGGWVVKSNNHTAYYLSLHGQAVTI